MTTAQQTKPKCHPDSPHKARNLCQACYDRLRYTGALSALLPKVPKCHPERKHYGLGLCQQCWTEEYIKRNPERKHISYLKHKDKQLQAQRLRRQENREVVASYHKEYQARNPDKARNNQLKRLYGITLADYNCMLVAQKQLCKFCGGPLTGKVVVDHNHKTRIVRGIVHQRCNIIIGFFETHPSLFRNLNKYLGIKDWGLDETE